MTEPRNKQLLEMRAYLDFCVDCKHDKKEIFEEPCRDCFDLQVVARNFEKEEEADE